MFRRKFLGSLLGGGLVAGLIAACTRSQPEAESSGARQKFSWRMVTTWPKNFPGLGEAPEKMATLVNAMSGGRLQIKVYAAGELVPAFEVFDFVSSGSAEIGHSGPYYWKGKVQSAQLFTSVPFGMTAQEINAWMFYGGGLNRWQQLYEPFGLLPFPCGNTGVQMGGWYRRTIDSIEDFAGLKIRIPGIGGEILRRAGATPVNLPGGELFTALENGTIDAVEWVGPYNDLAFGFPKIAPYYYYPGWHETGSTLECIVSLEAYNALPPDLRAIVKTAALAVNHDMLCNYTARNFQALQTIMDDYPVQLKKFSDEILIELKKINRQVISEISAEDETFAAIYEDQQKFLKQVSAWHAISEAEILRIRTLDAGG